MKRLLALLLLVTAPAFAQELPPTYVNTGNLINTTYPETYGFADGVAPFEQVGIGGVVMDPNDWDGDGFYYQFSYMPGAIIVELDISSLQVNNLTVFLTSFAFKTDCNNSIGGSCENPMGPQDWIRSRMELFTAEGLFGSYNMFNSGDGTFYSYGGPEWYGAFNYVNSGMVDLNSETAYFTSARLIVEGMDMGYWGGLYGPKIDSLNLQIEYDSALQGLAIQPIAPDCTVNPNDPTCIINDLIDFTDEEPVMLADTGSDNGSSDGSEVVAEEDPAPVEEMLAAADPVTEELVEDAPAEESLEELLAEESVEEDELDEEVTAVAAIKEMVNEEKASALSDNISKDVLGAALSVAADAVSAATVAGSESASSSTSSDSSSRSTTLTAATSETVATATETVVATESASEATKEESTESSALAALDILDTGRQLGQEALAITLAGTEASAIESLSEAENISAVSSSDSVLASMNSIETAAAIVTEEQQVASNETAAEIVTEETVAAAETEVVVAENNVETTEQTVAETVEQKEEVKEEVLVAVETQVQQATETPTEQREEVIVAETTSETTVENVEQVVAEVQTEQPSAVEFTTVEQAMEVFASNVSTQVAAEQEELENNIIQQAIASSQTNDEENRMGFAEAEAVTIASDPALANAFNVQPNTTSLELLGVLGSRAEEKSDAEVRAEQVVAANKEQQDAINANYMDADQSGIVAAIGSDADVSSYLSQRLTDVPFYKPEDIYKNIVYKDNVRGAYFLEKGNTDTYKKMVEEQYKDE